MDWAAVSIIICLGNALAVNGDATMPIYVASGVPDGWTVSAVLLDLEWGGDLRFSAVRPGAAFASSGALVHASWNENLGANCAACVPDQRLRFLVLAYAQAMADLSAPVAEIDFTGVAGDVGLTCTQVGETDCDGFFMTFTANVVLENVVTHELHEVARGYPESGNVEVQGAGVHAPTDVLGPPTDAPWASRTTWSRVKALYR